jgi:hypothetical protein
VLCVEVEGSAIAVEIGISKQMTALKHFTGHDLWREQKTVGAASL